MINPNRETSEDVLRRLKEASYERTRNELKCSVELLMKDFDMGWDDIGRLLGMKKKLQRPREEMETRADLVKWKIIQGPITLNDLNTLAHLFSCEPYIIFRPREPWVKT